MKKIIFLILCLVLTGCSNNTIEENTTEITTEELSNEQKAIAQLLQEQAGVYLLFGQNGTEVPFDLVDVYDEDTKEITQVWQISPDFYLRMFTDENALNEIRYYFADLHLSMDLNQDYIDLVGLTEDQKTNDIISVYKLSHFTDGTPIYTKVTSRLDNEQNIIIMHPEYAGTYFIGSKINNNSDDEITTTKTDKTILNIAETYDKEYVRDISKYSYGILIEGKATVEIYSQTDELITTISNKDISEVQNINENACLITLGEMTNDTFNSDSIIIQASEDINYHYKVIPYNSCNITTIKAYYDDIKTKSKDITKWDLSNPDDDKLEILENNANITTSKIYKFK